jgi:hypothetical protein
MDTLRLFLISFLLMFFISLCCGALFLLAGFL